MRPPLKWQIVNLEIIRIRSGIKTIESDAFEGCTNLRTFIVDENGAMKCDLSSVEVMGRDSSIVSTHASSVNPFIRSIVDSDIAVSVNSKVVRYNLKAHKVFIFDKETEQRIYFSNPSLSADKKHTGE